MVVIGTNFFGAALTFAAGAGIAAANFAFSRYILVKRPSAYVGMQVIRQLIQIAYLVILFLFGRHTPWNPIWLLVGGALGITLPMFYFTYRLVKFNDSLHGKEKSSDG